MKPIRVLFLSTGNAARSQMAEAYLRQVGNAHFEAYSAGLEPSGVNPFTVRVMEEVGLDISHQRSKSVSEFLGKVHFHYLITVCDDAEKNCPTVWPGINQRLHWVFDPLGALEGTEVEKLAKFRQVRDQIKAQIQDWLAVTQFPV